MNGARTSVDAAMTTSSLAHTTPVTDWRVVADRRSFDCRIVTVDSVAEQSARDHTIKPLSGSALYTSPPPMSVGNYG